MNDQNEVAGSQTGSADQTRSADRMEALPLSQNQGAQPADHQQMIKERRLARPLALQALFEVDVTVHQPGTVVDAHLLENHPGAHAAHFLRWLVGGVVRNQAHLDELIAK
ncbi:MAG: hypothetical protein M3Q45_10610, partial [Chloroflexota bacterium]|nr:hypothetical protein [Chloroflexota bacterium]